MYEVNYNGRLQCCGVLRSGFKHEGTGNGWIETGDVDLITIFVERDESYYENEHKIESVI